MDPDSFRISDLTSQEFEKEFKELYSEVDMFMKDSDFNTYEFKVNEKFFLFKRQ